MSKLVMLGLMAYTSAFAFAAEINQVHNRGGIKSTVIKSLLPVAEALHADAEKEYSPAGGREARVYLVSAGRNESENDAIFQLVDEVNTFDSAVDGEETVNVDLVFSPTYEDISVAFVSDYEDEFSEELVGKISALRTRLRSILFNAKHLVFYKILSSNEAQGHLGFVLYNRRTQEALYVSSVSDH